LNLSTKISAEALKKSRPFMMLANVMGKVLIDLAGEPIKTLEVSLFGEASEAEVRAVSVEALVGILAGQVSTPVNSVNAENLAKKQGLSLVESTTEETEGYVSLVKLVGICADKTVSVVGTLLGDRHPRIVNVNQFEIEVVPEGTLLVTDHNDKPGVISAISAILGESNINITRMQVGVPDSNDKAMAVISVSSPLSADILAKVKDLSFVNCATLINL
jgi:D-3-phosphoglycerate dehydrogenase